MRKFYGVRFLGGNRTCTWGNPGKNGRYNIAADIEVFRTRAERDEWVAAEKITAPSGRGGGERVVATKAECRRIRRGETVAEFEDTLAEAERSRYWETD
jgi:predicted DNA-binding WGR domain protein